MITISAIDEQHAISFDARTDINTTRNGREVTVDVQDDDPRIEQMLVETMGYIK